MPNGRQNNKRHPFERVKRWLKLWRYKILRIDDRRSVSPGARLSACSWGAPTFGVGGFLAIGIAFLLKANKAAASSAAS